MGGLFECCTFMSCFIPPRKHYSPPSGFSLVQLDPSRLSFSHVHSCFLWAIMRHLKNCSMLMWPRIFIKGFVCVCFFQANLLSIMLKTNNYSILLRWSSPNLLFQLSWWVWSTDNMQIWVILLQTMHKHLYSILAFPWNMFKKIMFLIKSGNRKETK